MLGFFRKAADFICEGTYFLLMVADLVVGIMVGNSTGEAGWGWLIVLGGWFVLTALYSFAGTFIGMAEDIAKIRKKLEKSSPNTEPPKMVLPENTESSNHVSFIRQSAGLSSSSPWECPNCDCLNSGNSAYCENCGNRKP